MSEPVPSRQLVIHVLMSLFVSIAVFAVLSYATLVPRLVQHEKRIQELEAQIAAMQQEPEEAEEPAAAAPATPPPAVQPAVAK